MGRGRVELKMIENRVNRQVTFSKRRKGLLKKAHELAVLCDVQLAVVVFSERGKLFEYSNPPCSMSDLIRRYEITTNPQQFHEADGHDQQLLVEMARLTSEKEQLESNLRICTGEDLSPLSVDDLIELEQYLQSVLSKVRARKHELQTQLLDDLRSKTDKSSHDAAAEGVEMAPSTTLSGSPFPMEPVSPSSKALQLWPQPADSVGGGGFGSSSPRGATSCSVEMAPSTTLSGSPIPMEPVSPSSTALQLWPQPADGVGGGGGFDSSSPRGATSCSRTRASPGGRGLQLW